MAENTTPSNQQDIEDSFKKESLQDRIYIAFTKYKQPIALGIVALLLIGLGYAGLHWYQERQLKQLQAAYLTAVESGKALEFAEKNIKKTLGGTVFLEAADRAFEQGNYQTATDLYAKSLKSLQHTALAKRAKLSQALVSLEKGDLAEAEKQLFNLLNTKGLGTLSAEVRYHLALLYLEKGQFEKAKSQLQTLLTEENASLFRGTAEMLMEVVYEKNSEK